MNWDFPAVMVLLVVISGLIWALDAWLLAPHRVEDEAASESKMVEYARSFFPIFLAVLLLRSFLVEPFRIPSNSMMPTLLTGDFILVNKYTYGIRLPVLNRKIFSIGRPQRGDVIVFRYPKDPTTPFIKRVVGEPGDHVSYYNKVLYVNGVASAQEVLGAYQGTGSGSEMTGASLRYEQLGDVRHSMLVQGEMPSMEGEMVVPEGHYFVLGDNRDNSRDSRYWGTVPDENLIGKAFAIWMHWDWGFGPSWGRIGQSID